MPSSCTPTGETQTLSCLTGHIGTWTQRRDYACPSGTWSAWYDVTKTCAAACTPVDSSGCGTAGTAMYNGVCQSGAYAGWEVAGGVWRTCTAAPACTPTSETQMLTCPAGYVGSWQQRRDYSCPSGTWGAWYDVANTCTVAQCPISCGNRAVNLGDTVECLQSTVCNVQENPPPRYSRTPGVDTYVTYRCVNPALGPINGFDAVKTRTETPTKRCTCY